jgi:hypothetical protein
LDPKEVVRVVPQMLAALIKQRRPRGDKGGAYCIVDPKTRECIIPPTIVGIVREDKRERYLALCLEKALRLAEHDAEGHCLSWQSRDHDQDRWGGAIHDGLHIWGFSGMKEDQDEAIMLMSAHMCGQIMNGEPKSVAEISNNRIIMDGKYLFWVPRG